MCKHIFNIGRFNPPTGRRVQCSDEGNAARRRREVRVRARRRGSRAARASPRGRQEGAHEARPDQRRVRPQGLRAARHPPQIQPEVQGQGAEILSSFDLASHETKPRSKGCPSCAIVVIITVAHGIGYSAATGSGYQVVVLAE